MKANWITAAIVVVALVGVWLSSLGAYSYKTCNEHRRAEYVQAEVIWFNALNVAEKHRFSITEHEYTNERNAAYDARAESLKASLKERC